MPYPTNFYATGIAEYDSVGSGNTVSTTAVPADGCNFTNQQYINGSQQIQVTTICYTKVQAVVQSVMSACFNNQCAVAYGQVRQGV